MSSEMISRRELLKLGVIAGAGAVMPPLTVAASETANQPLRIAHLTDSHTQPELHAADGTMACLRHVRARSPAVGMTIVGDADLVTRDLDAKIGVQPFQTVGRVVNRKPRPSQPGNFAARTPAAAQNC